MLYPSPESNLLEAIDGTQELAGMFVRRGTTLGLKEGVELSEFLHQINKEKKIEQFEMKLVEKETAVPSYLSSDLKIILGYLDKKFEFVEKKADYLLQNNIMKQDLNRLLSLTAQRRGLVIPNQAILKHIETSEFVEIKSFPKMMSDD